ncbi:MAG: hypothetical protein WC517_02015 [Patescibacteria group bacterium]
MKRVKSWAQIAREFETLWDELEREMIAEEEAYFEATSELPLDIDWAEIHRRNHSNPGSFESLVEYTTALAYKERKKQKRIGDEWALFRYPSDTGKSIPVTEEQWSAWSELFHQSNESYEVNSCASWCWESEIDDYEWEEQEKEDERRYAEINPFGREDSPAEIRASQREWDAEDAMLEPGWKHAQRRQRDEAAMHRKLRLATHHGYWPAENDDFDCPTWVSGLDRWDREIDRYLIPRVLGGYHGHRRPLESSSTAITAGFEEWLEPSDAPELIGMMTNWHGKPATSVPLSKRIRRTRAKIGRTEQWYKDAVVIALRIRERRFDYLDDEDRKYYEERPQKLLQKIKRLNMELERLEQEQKEKKTAAKKQHFEQNQQESFGSHQGTDGCSCDWSLMAAIFEFESSASARAAMKAVLYR